jgi:hypothetical protein
VTSISVTSIYTTRTNSGDAQKCLQRDSKPRSQQSRCPRTYNAYHIPSPFQPFYLMVLIAFDHVQRMEENRIPKRLLYVNLGTTRLRGRPRNRWQD